MPTSPDPSQQLIEALRRDGDVGEPLIALVYEDLRALAGRYLQNERVGHTLQPTALVNEAMLRVLPEAVEADVAKERFMAIAARCMRQVLVDHARRRGAQKRGGPNAKVTLVDVESAEDQHSVDLLLLDRALEALAQEDARMARIIELQYFGGLTGEQAARELGVSRSTVKREASVGRAWLQREMKRLGAEPE